MSIHPSENEREKEQNEEVEEICFQPLSSSQSVCSHTNLFISPLDRREGDRQGETDREAKKINAFKKRKYIEEGKTERESDSIREP